MLGLGRRLKVILPAGDYRARKVAPDNAAELDRLLAGAASVTVMGFDPSSREAYMAASNQMLAEVDTVIATWDGQPARRHGSTADVVAAARHLGLVTTIRWPTGVRRDPPPATVCISHPATVCISHPALHIVLAGVGFPAQRWEIVIYAQLYGADRHTGTLLADLPEGTCGDLEAVTAAVSHHRG